MTDKLISWNEYFSDLAQVVSLRANCKRRKVGSVLVRNNRIISTGYNGTASGFTNCLEGGCRRCSSNVPSGQGYDECVCVHAEENAILECARIGVPCDGASIYTTLQPCFTCLKNLRQAGIEEVYYNEVWDSITKSEAYKELANTFRLFCNI